MQLLSHIQAPLEHYFKSKNTSVQLERSKKLDGPLLNHTMYSHCYYVRRLATARTCLGCVPELQSTSVPHQFCRSSLKWLYTKVKKLYPLLCCVTFYSDFPDLYQSA